jgi:hypothetical protein
VAAEDEPFHQGVLGGHPADLEAEVEARPLPGHPADAVPEALAGEPLAVLGRRQGDDGVAVHVVDVAMGDEAVGRGVDGGGARVEVEEAVGEEPRHLVLVLLAAVDRLQGLQLVDVEGGEAVHAGRAQVAPGALDVEHADLLPREGVDLLDLGRGVAAPVVRDATVGAQEVRTVDELLRLGEARGLGVVPEVRQAVGQASAILSMGPLGRAGAL